jgi:hypothetical protein
MVYASKDYGDLTPLLPFFVLDVAYQIYTHDILPLRCSHQAQRWRTEWGRNYGLMNRRFFASFNDEQKDAVIDRMDDLESFIEESVLSAREVVRDFLLREDACPEEMVGPVSACLISNILIQSASIIWEQVYTDPHGRPRKNQYIETIARASSRFLNSWLKPDRDIRCNDDKGVDDSAVRMQSRLVAWLKQSNDGSGKEGEA